ncbi:MAG: hypothetical protein MI757_16555 [Pirellulales bacterium]|nr:hypothetical protein [Pirellulales bacterium]
MRETEASDLVRKSAKIERLEEFAIQRDFVSAPEIVEAIDDPSPEVRQAAVDAAEQVLGASVRVHAHDSSEERRAAVASYGRMIQLAEETGETYLIDTMPALIDRMEDVDETTRRQAYEDLKLLTGSGLRFRADAPLAERQRVVERYRSLWRLWNEPGNDVLVRLRDPEKMREYKRRRVAEVKRRRAEAGQ